MLKRRFTGAPAWVDYTYQIVDRINYGLNKTGG